MEFQELVTAQVVIVAAAAVIFLFPAERFFKPHTRDLGTMTIGGPAMDDNATSEAHRSEPWFRVLLEIDRLYFEEGKLTDAIRVAESTLEIVPKKNWTIFSHLLVFHGRAICKARKPDCPNCPIKNYCPAANAPDLW